MAKVYLYLSGCALLLLLRGRASTGLPLLPPPPPPTPGVPVPAPAADHCAALFRDLQLRIRSVVNETFCHGVFTSNEMTVWSQDTVQACAPTLTQNSKCMVQRNTPFNESECVGSIMKDLAYYDAALQSYLSPLSHEVEVQRLSSALGVIQSLRKSCNPLATGDNSSLKEDTANMWNKDSFENRKKMCKMMRGFHVRAITINRALGYISSGDHRK